MLSRKNKKSDNTLYTGLSLHQNGARAALMRALPGGGVRLEQLSEAPGSLPRQQQISTALSGLGSVNTPLTTVLSHSDYTLVQLEAPDLPPEEVNEALRWRIRDMINFPVDEALIDHFNLPQSQRAGAARLAYVVAARPDKVNEIVEAVPSKQLSAVDIPEMAMRDLVMHTQEEQTFAYLYLSPHGALIEICHGNEIYLSRQVDIASGLFEDNENTQADMDDLLLEVQRSLDYFQSLYASGPVDGLQVLSTSYQVEAAFVLSAGIYLSVPVASFDLSAIDGLEAFSDEQQRRALLAMGAAIREMPCAA